MKEYLKFIKPLTREEVLSSWEKNEAMLERWIAHYKKRGFNSWKDWRINTVKDLNLGEKKWKLYEIIDPAISLPNFFGGPFRAWIKNIYQGRTMLPFSEIVKSPQVQKNIGESKIIENFPVNNFFVGLKIVNGIVIIEGMHRCCAIALAAERKRSLSIKATIALADFPDNEIPLLGNADSPT